MISIKTYSYINGLVFRNINNNKYVKLIKCGDGWFIPLLGWWLFPDDVIAAGVSLYLSIFAEKYYAIAIQIKHDQRCVVSHSRFE